MNDAAPGVAETRSTCPYCGVGCGVIIESRGAQITGVRGDPEHPANFGRLCSKGSLLHLSACAPVTRQLRLTQPMRRMRRGDAAQPVPWGDALDYAAEGFAQIVREHGPDATAFYISGQFLTEDYYVFNKLAKGLLGTNNIDSNSRLCMSSAVAGYKATLGADAPPACYDDIAHAHTLFVAGSNTAFAHPVLMRRIEDARRANPAQRLIVVDPRRTETADAADLFLQTQPGTDVALFHGMLHVMLWDGLLDQAFIAAHTSGFDALKQRVRDFPPKDTAALCGVAEADLVKAARWFAGLDSPAGSPTDGPSGGSSGGPSGGPVGPADGRAAGARSERRPTLSLYCQGLNQSSSGTAKNAALINLHLATGQIGRCGAGPFSLTGQPNAMGGREVGGMANLLSGHRDLGNAEHRAEVARLWDVPSVPEHPGKTAVEMFQAAADGEIKALWIACTNPAQSMPDQATVRRALQRAELVIVQEAFANTATCEYADLLLPATTWGEKDGTVTNSERRISRVRRAVPGPGATRDDWAIGVEFARRLESRLRPDAPSLFTYERAEDVWLEHRESTRGRDLDITGLSYAALEAAPQQWPLPENATDARPARAATAQGRARLYEDGRFPTPDGRARFFDTPYQPLAEPRDARYPFALNTGRLRDQWHGMSRTGTVSRLFGHAPEPAIEMHAQDMARLGLSEGALVHVTSRRGSLLLPARSSAQVAPAQSFIAMHWGSEFLGGRSSTGEALAGVNAVTSSAACATSRQPELKHSAVKILKAELPWRLLAMAWLEDEAALQAHEQLKPLLAGFAFASCVRFGFDRCGILFRAAAHEPAAGAWLRRIEAALGLDASSVLRYEDKRRGQQRCMRLAGSGEATRLEAFLLAGDTLAEDWIAPLLQQQLSAHEFGRRLLVPGARPPIAITPRGRQVCNCFDVREDQIDATLRGCTGTPAQRLAQLQDRLKCATNCGSCKPELERMVRLDRRPLESVAL